jgi:hypothetical protein
VALAATAGLAAAAPCQWTGELGMQVFVYLIFISLPVYAFVKAVRWLRDGTVDDKWLSRLDGSAAKCVAVMVIVLAAVVEIMALLALYYLIVYQVITW